MPEGTGIITNIDFCYFCDLGSEIYLERNSENNTLNIISGDCKKYENDKFLDSIKKKKIVIDKKEELKRQFSDYLDSVIYYLCSTREEKEEAELKKGLTNFHSCSKKL